MNSTLEKKLEEKIERLTEQYKDKTVFVGLSGGVDSAVVAAILTRANVNVIGIFMKNWAGESALQIDCPWQEDQESAESVANHLKIEFASYNFEKEYKQRVFDYFLSEYSAGRTPNPDILCNSEIKFAVFREKALSQGADFIATGHYADKSIIKLAGEDKYLLVRGADPDKDQTYFLSNLNQDQLAKSIFPLGGLTKPEVREIAKYFQLPNANRKDSQGICFIGDLDVQKFLRKYLEAKPGNIVDIDSNQIIGQHDGMQFFTIGQRQGIGIGGVEKPYYVVKKSALENIVWVAQGNMNPHLWSKEVIFSDLHEVASTALDYFYSQLTASIRYRHKPSPGSLRLEQGKFIFAEPQRALAPGQSLVFFAGKYCLGRAIISN